MTQRKAHFALECASNTKNDPRDLRPQLVERPHHYLIEQERFAVGADTFIVHQAAGNGEGPGGVDPTPFTDAIVEMGELWVNQLLLGISAIALRTNERAVNVYLGHADHPQFEGLLGYQRTYAYLLEIQRIRPHLPASLGLDITIDAANDPRHSDGAKQAVAGFLRSCTRKYGCCNIYREAMPHKDREDGHHQPSLSHDRFLRDREARPGWDERKRLISHHITMLNSTAELEAHYDGDPAVFVARRWAALELEGVNYEPAVGVFGSHERYQVEHPFPVVIERARELFMEMTR